MFSDSVKYDVGFEMIVAAFDELSIVISCMTQNKNLDILVAAELISNCLLSGGKLLACGNGGSAADAQHFVAELIGRMSIERRSLPAISLSTDPSVVTALGNDYGYDQIFKRQVEGLGQKGDVLLVISTSGRSPNIIQAIQTAQANGLKTVALVGNSGDSILSTCDSCIQIPASNTQRIQELHMVILHILCEFVEKQLVEVK